MKSEVVEVSVREAAEPTSDFDKLVDETRRFEKGDAENEIR